MFKYGLVKVGSSTFSGSSLFEKTGVDVQYFRLVCVRFLPNVLRIRKIADGLQGGGIVPIKRERLFVGDSRRLGIPGSRLSLSKGAPSGAVTRRDSRQLLESLDDFFPFAALRVRAHQPHPGRGILLILTHDLRVGRRRRFGILLNE